MGMEVVEFGVLLVDDENSFTFYGVFPMSVDVGQMYLFPYVERNKNSLQSYEFCQVYETSEKEKVVFLAVTYHSSGTKSRHVGVAHFVYLSTLVNYTNGSGFENHSVQNLVLRWSLLDAFANITRCTRVDDDDDTAQPTYYADNMLSVFVRYKTLSERILKKITNHTSSRMSARQIAAAVAASSLAESSSSVQVVDPPPNLPPSRTAAASANRKKLQQQEQQQENVRIEEKRLKSLLNDFKLGKANHLMGLSVVDLRYICSHNKITQNGKKDAIIKRMELHLQ
jgi:hypothetical protein